MKKILILLVLIIYLGCTRERRATISATDNRSEVYNDILNELVKKHFYNRYLGSDFEKIEERFDLNWDSPEFKNEVEQLSILVGSDISKQRSICIGNKLSMVRLSQLSIDNFNDSLNNPGDLRNIFKHVSSDYNAVYDSLTTPRQFSANHFYPSSFKVNTRGCEIGGISFSKVFFSTQGDKGLLYYEFVCDEKCGKGEILWVENKAGHWIIEQHRRMWIM